MEQLLRELLREARCAVLDALPVGVCWLGLDLRYRCANAAYLRDHGQAWEDVAERAAPDVVGEPWAALEERVARALRGDVVDFRLFAKWNGGPALVAVRYQPVLRAGRVESLVVTRQAVSACGPFPLPTHPPQASGRPPQRPGPASPGQVQRLRLVGRSRQP